MIVALRSCLVFLFIFSSAQANTSSIDFSKLANTKNFNTSEVGYIQFVPEYEKKMDPKKAVSIEIYFGVYDGSEKSIKNLESIKDIIEDDKKLLEKHGRRPEVIAHSVDAENVAKSKNFQGFLNTLNLDENKFSVSQVPASLRDSKKLLEKQRRNPSSKIDYQKYVWTLIRASSSAAGVFLGMHFAEGLTVGASAALAVLPAIGSGGFIYYNELVGKFFENGKWTSWLLYSDKPYAKKLRKAFGIDPDAFLQKVIKDKRYIKSQYPSLYKENQALLDLQQRGIHNNTQLRRLKLQHLYSTFKTAEEYLKWWVTELVFVAAVIKTPQVIGGVGAAFTIESYIGDIVQGSISGLIAQGPGDLAIQKRKYQMFEELKSDLLLGRVVYDDQELLLKQLKTIIQKKNIPDGQQVHSAIMKIENISRARATIFSFFSVTGIAMQIAQIPNAEYIIYGSGALGGIYFSHVKGWIKLPNPTAYLKQLVTDIRNGGIKHYMRMTQIRSCEKPFFLN